MYIMQLYINYVYILDIFKFNRYKQIVLHVIVFLIP